MIPWRFLWIAVLLGTIALFQHIAKGVNPFPATYATTTYATTTYATTTYAMTTEVTASEAKPTVIA